MFGLIAAALGLIGTLAGIAWKWKAANTASAADRAAATEAIDANSTIKASAEVTDAARAAVQEKTDANASSTAALAAGVAGADSVQHGADALNAAIDAANRPAN